MDRINIIKQFYQEFNLKDFQAMNQHYAKEVEFYDPAFRLLKNDEVRAMWHMLCAAARDLSIECTSATIMENGKVNATWEAHYTFSGTGRRVHNVINAEFTFIEDKIIQHHDHFDMSKWTRMALGTPGVLLGWTSWMKNKVSGKARNNLLKFMRENPDYQVQSLSY